MDASSAIIAAILVVLSSLPFIIMSINKKKKNKQILQSLTEIAIHNECVIHISEISHKFVIGIDEQKSVIFFQKRIKDKQAIQIIKLNDFEACNLIKDTSFVGDKNNQYSVIDRLSLSFIPNPSNNPDYELEFYNADVSVQLLGELESITKWSKIIEIQLKKNRVEVFS